MCGLRVVDILHTLRGVHHHDNYAVWLYTVWLDYPSQCCPAVGALADDPVTALAKCISSSSNHVERDRLGHVGNEVDLEQLFK